MKHGSDRADSLRFDRRGHGHAPVRSSASFGVASGVAGSAGISPAATGRGAGLSQEIVRTELPNGVIVVSERIPSVRSVSAGVWIRQGGAHERTEAEAGASHLLEHMVFKGTERRSAADIAWELERLGGSLDAYTTREHTSYQARVLDAHLPEALDVLSDLVLAPRLDEADLALEREVVLEEIATVEDTPDDLVFELHAERFWNGHPYGRPILGTTESVAGMSADTLRGVHGRSYTGANLIVAVAGNVDHDEILDRAARYFGDVPAGLRTPGVLAPEPARRGFEFVERPSAQSHLVFATDIPGHADPDRYAHSLLSAALGGGMSSRLFQKVREELALCYSVFSFQSFYSARGVSGVYVGTRRATAAKAEDAIRTELDRIAAEGLQRREFEDIRTQVKGQIMLSLESTGSRMHRLASLELHEEPFVGLDELLGRIDAVTLEDVQRVARGAYAADEHFVLTLGPGA